MLSVKGGWKLTSWERNLEVGRGRIEVGVYHLLHDGISYGTDAVTHKRDKLLRVQNSRRGLRELVRRESSGFPANIDVVPTSCDVPNRPSVVARSKTMAELTESG